ncbi:hypothetical protein [Paenibacillus alvei]|nr:hypothetical protein [Paenibacillus alvei]
MGETRRILVVRGRSSTAQLLEEHREIYNAIAAQNEQLSCWSI